MYAQYILFLSLYILYVLYIDVYVITTNRTSACIERHSSACHRLIIKKNKGGKNNVDHIEEKNKFIIKICLNKLI